MLDEEEDLRKSHQGDTDTPYIKKNFFKEIFESERGSMLKMHGAELSSDSENEEPSATEAAHAKNHKSDTVPHQEHDQ